MQKLAFAAAMAACCLPTTSCAQNLVPNPGFEETDSCTFGLGLGALHDWYSAFGTPDHLQSCLPYGSANGLPLNQFTYQQPFGGNSCVGIFTYDGSSGQEWREWLIVPLLDTLVPGATYYCSFRTNAAFGGTSLTLNQLASDHVGMLFTTYDKHWTWGDPYPAAINQAQVLYPQILSDTVKWTLVSGSFVADSAYTYLMIGNFFSNVLTDTIRFASDVPGWAQYSYVLIDAVCVSSSLDECESNLGVGDLDGSEPFVYPNPASDVLVIGNMTGRDAVLLNLQGQQVWCGRVNTERYAVDVGGWARGTYVLQVHDTRSAQVLKFVLVE